MTKNHYGNHRVSLNKSSSRRNVTLWENIFEEVPCLNKKYSHRLLSISWRILHRKRRILQSMMPNEDPEIVIYLFIYYLEGFLVKTIILLPCQQRFLSDVVSFMSLTFAWLAQSFKKANYSNVSDVNDFTNAKTHAENISLLAGYPTTPILMENLALYNLDLPDAFRVPLKATVWYSSVQQLLYYIIHTFTNSTA